MKIIPRDPQFGPVMEALADRPAEEFRYPPECTRRGVVLAEWDRWGLAERWEPVEPVQELWERLQVRGLAPSDAPHRLFECVDPVCRGSHRGCPGSLPYPGDSLAHLVMWAAQGLANVLKAEELSSAVMKIAGSSGVPLTRVVWVGVGGKELGDEAVEGMRRWTRLSRATKAPRLAENCEYVPALSAQCLLGDRREWGGRLSSQQKDSRRPLRDLAELGLWMRRFDGRAGWVELVYALDRYA